MHTNHTYIYIQLLYHTISMKRGGDEEQKNLQSDLLIAYSQLGGIISMYMPKVWQYNGCR